jgi:hypothetical protein
VQGSPKLDDIFPLPDKAKRLQVFVGDLIVDGTLTLSISSQMIA